MGVFGPVFGRSGDVGFSGPLLEASSGVVGFNVATLSRREREKGRPAHEKWLKIGVFWRAGRVFRGRVAGGAVLGEFCRDNRYCAGLGCSAVHFRLAAVGVLQH